MRRIRFGLAGLAVICAVSVGLGQAPQAPPAPNTDAHYQLGPDSFPRDGVPKGEVKGPYTG